MTLSRRRFLSISAAFACAPKGAVATTWQGRAFGADISMTIRGGGDAKEALREARQVIKKIEGLFSLYDPASALARLNQTGELKAPDPWFLELMTASDDAYIATLGLFDPTVQRLWSALAARRNFGELIDTIGWDRVTFDAARISLGQRQSLTFNGIAQGFATDKVTDVLIAHGLTDVLVNIGEHRGVGGPWRLALRDPDHGDMGMRTLTTGAIATSSPNATDLIPGGHIIHSDRFPQWSTVCVEADSAAVADAVSTALVLATRDEVEDIANRVNLARVTLVDLSGNLVTL